MSFHDKQERSIRLSTLLICVGSLLGAYSSFAFVAMLCKTLAGTYSLANGLPSVGWFVVLSVLSGLFVKWKLNDRRSVVQLMQEQSILQYAAFENGRPLTVSEVATNCCLTVTDTVNVLQRMASLDVCDVVVNENGKVRYAFADAVKLAPPELVSKKIDLRHSSDIPNIPDQTIEPLDEQ